MSKTLPPEILKLAPHVDPPLLLQLGVQLLQHCGHRRLVQLTRGVNRGLLARVVLYQVEPAVI